MQIRVTAAIVLDPNTTIFGAVLESTIKQFIAAIAKELRLRRYSQDTATPINQKR